MVESVLQGHSIIERGKNNELFPGLIAKWKRQYLYKKFHGNSASDIELKNLKAKLCELEQMIGKLPTKLRKRVCTKVEKRKFIYNNWAKFRSIKEGCRKRDLPVSAQGR